MKTLLKGVAILLACLALAPSAFAQAANGNGGCADRVLVSYYKIIPGRRMSGSRCIRSGTAA